jgi:hypothetical protein
MVIGLAWGLWVNVPKVVKVFVQAWRFNRQ